MIEINQSIGASLEDMRCMVESKCLQHRVLWDEDCQNTRAYGISAWPFAYLIGPDGKVFWEGNPSQWIHRAEKADTLRLLIEHKLAGINRVVCKSSPPQ